MGRSKKPKASDGFVSLLSEKGESKATGKDPKEFLMMAACGLDGHSYKLQLRNSIEHECDTPHKEAYSGTALLADSLPPESQSPKKLHSSTKPETVLLRGQKLHNSKPKLLLLRGQALISERAHSSPHNSERLGEAPRILGFRV